MRDGVAWEPLDASFAQAVNAVVNYHVFLTAGGDSNGLFVAQKTSAGFEVREHGGGTSNLSMPERLFHKGQVHVAGDQVRHNCPFSAGRPAAAAIAWNRRKKTVRSSVPPFCDVKRKSEPSAGRCAKISLSIPVEDEEVRDGHPQAFRDLI